jgi:hypothetical protein
MSTEIAHAAETIGPAVTLVEEVPMVRQERWEELRRLWQQERVPVAELARRFELDRKTVRRCLREPVWRPYQRSAPTETLLTAHAEYLRARAPKVRYSAQILYQELRQQGYRGSYQTVKRFVRPLRTARLLSEGTLTRFETPPGAQSQIDWGTATVRFRQQPRVVHLFVLTLGFSRRGFYQACPNETLGQFLDAHERAFEYFGGHTPPPCPAIPPAFGSGSGPTRRGRRARPARRAHPGGCPASSHDAGTPSASARDHSCPQALPLAAGIAVQRKYSRFPV